MDAILLRPNQQQSKGDLEKMFNPFELNPESLWLEIPENLQTQCRKEANTQFASKAQPLGYLNLLSQTVIFPEIFERFPSAQLTDLQSELWELGINGFAISIGQQRLMIVPSDSLDLDEFRIPQEWIDIPTLAADYYLAAQVDTEEKLIRIWGYTTHQNLKKESHYDSGDRTYCLEYDEVNEDLNALWLSRQYVSEVATRSPIAVLPKISLDDLTHSLEILANPELIFARRAVPFETWANIIENDHWRHMLIEHRRPQTKPEINRLSKWFENQFEAGWQTIHHVIAPHQMGGAFMANLIKRAKLIDLAVELANHQFALMITLAKAEAAVTIQASVYPTGEQSTLPPNLNLSILTESGEIFKELTSRTDDAFIRYEFDAQPGDRFDVKVSLGESSVTETFLV
jgi:hypothetical protein